MIRHLQAKHRLIQVTKEPAKTKDVVVVADGDLGESSQQLQKRQKLERTGPLDSFVQVKKESIQMIIAELAARDGFTFHQLSDSRRLKELLKSSGYAPPQSPSTVQRYTAQEAARFRNEIGDMLQALKLQGKKFTTSVDEQTTAANYRILNVQVYSENGAHNLGMIRINVSCKADEMVKVGNLFCIIKVCNF